MDNNDFILKIVAELEKKGIKTGYDKLKKELEKDPAKIDVILNTSGTVGKTKGSIKKLAAELHNELSVEIAKLQKQGQNINFDLSVGDVEEVIQNVISHTKKLEQNFDSASAKAQKFLSQFNKKSGGTLINSAEYKAVQEAIDGLGNTHSIDDLNKSMNTLEITYNNMVSNLRNGGKSLNPFINAINDMKNMDSTLKGIELDFQSLSSKPKAVADSIKDLHTQQQKVNQYSQGTVEWAQEYGILQSKIVQVKNEIQNVAKAEKASNTDESNRVTYYQRIIDNNKTIYSLKNKLLTADKEQTAEINRQIKALEERNRYNEKQLSKKGLTDNSWEQSVNSSKSALENQLRINTAKQEDIARTKTIAQAEKEAANAAKERQSIESQSNKIKDSMAGRGKVDYNWQIDEEIKKLRNLGFTEEETRQKVKKLTDAHTELKNVINSNNFDSIESKNRAIIESDEKRTIALNQVKNAYRELKTNASQYYNLNKQTKLSTDIQNWLSKNSRASKEAKQSLQEYYRELGSGRVSVDRLDYIEKELKTIDAQQRGLGRLGKSLTDQFKQAGESFTQWLSVSSAIMLLISKTKDAVSELVELDSILTEISKTSDLTEQQLRNLGDSAFETASKYGRTASDYLIGVQEMYRAGFDNAEEMAELSILAQAAGDMESNSANDYLMATNAAYDFKGSVEELNKVLDSQNYITNNAAVSMQDMADATSEAASIAAQYGVEIDELSALIAVAASKTRESGSEVGTALKSIFVTLQDTTSKPVVDAFDSVGISMTKIVDGSERLKTPIELLKELAVAFNELPEGDTKRANILTDIGKKYHANTLSAILSDWNSFESMLDLYSQGMGSAAKEAEKSANNIQGSLNRLHNTWTDTVENVANSDAILTIVNAFNSFLSVVNKATDALGSFGTIGLGVGITAFVKNFA